MNNISTPTPAIAAFHARWKRNRDVIEGEYSVKAPQAGYIPRLPIHDTNSFPQTAEKSYREYLARCPFFPASSRILEGMMGMIFRKPPRLVASTAMATILEAATEDGLTAYDLAEKVVEEVLTTNFCGLLVDYPEVRAGISRAQAEREGARPFIRMYRAENILEVEVGVIANRRVITRVRLRDNAKTVRELVLNDGVYTVILHDHIGSQWVAREPIVPVNQGQPLNQIPFFVASTKAKSVEPTKAVMDDVCALNVQLFQAQANSANSLYYCANPLLYIKGVAASDIKISAGTILFFEQHSQEKPVEIGYAEFSGSGQASLDNAVQRVKDDLSTIGGRIIAPDSKAGVESAEALSLRKASENSVLASHANTISRAIKQALDFAASWVGSEPVEFALSTDFIPATMTAQERAQVVAEWMAGLYTHETALELMKDGEILPSSFDVEGEIERVQQDSVVVDRPSGLSDDSE